MDFGFNFEAFIRTCLALAAIVLGIASLWLGIGEPRNRYRHYRRTDSLMWAATYGFLGLTCALLAWQWPW
jgi:uncharacterized membrane protein YozB (DUF420 family)